MKKVVIISSSLRKHSNSESLALAFAAGAKESGNEVEFISLRGKNQEMKWNLFLFVGKQSASARAALRARKHRHV